MFRTKCFLRKTISFFSLIFIFLSSVAQQSPASFIMPSDASVYASDTIGYYRYFPSGYGETDKKFPLLFFLHGRGEAVRVDGNVNPLSDLLKSGTPPYILQYQDPKGLGQFIVVSPQSPQTKWYPDFVNGVMDHVLQTYDHIDTTKIYITGLSAGGNGTWNFALNYPERIAAIVPIASPGVVDTVCSKDQFAAWAFYGENDMGTERSWAAAYNYCGPAIPAEVTMIPGGEHNSRLWGTVYTNSPTSLANGEPTGLTEDSIYKWMLQYSRGLNSEVFPMAHAGQDQIIDSESSSTILEGDGFDPDGSVVSVMWTQLEGPTEAVFSDPTVVSATVSGLEEGDYVFKLTVTDNDDNSSSDQVTIMVKASLSESVIYRVNCGGLQESDEVLEWMEDKTLTPCPYINPQGYSLCTGSSEWPGYFNATDAPGNVFGNYRYGNSSKPMIYSFPLNEGFYEIKLYFQDIANAGGTNIFDVRSEGVIILDDFDIADEFGVDPGQKNTTVYVKDGILDLEFITVLGQSRIDGIEICKVNTIVTGNTGYNKVAQLSYLLQPDKKIIEITVGLLSDEVTSLGLYDLKGREIKSFSTGKCGEGQKCFITGDVSKMPSGIYLLVLKTRAGVSTEKVFIH